MRLLSQAVRSSEARARLFKHVTTRGIAGLLGRFAVQVPPARQKPAAKARKDWVAESQEAEAAFTAAGGQARAQDYVRFAHARRMCGDLAAAAALITQGCARFGATPGLLRETAELAMAEGRWAEAAAAWEATVAQSGDKSTPGSFVRWSTALQNHGAQDEALAVLKRGLALHAADPKINRAHVDLVWTRTTEEILARASHAVAPSLSVHDVCETFWALEQRLSLLAWRVGDVAPWPLLRMPLYYVLTQRLGLYDPPHPALKSQTEGARGWTPEFEAAWAALEAGGADGRAGVRRSAVLMATRKVGGSEPYTAAVRAELGAAALLLDVAPQENAAEDALPFHAYKDLFRARYRKADADHLPPEAIKLCEAIWREMHESFGVDIGNIARVCRNRVADFDAVSHGFKKLFAAHGVETLYLTNAYGASYRAVVHAARACGARVVELQHGFISRYHLGYSWPSRPDVPYSPDELWSFGAFWPESTPLPQGMGHRVIGAPYVKRLAEAAGQARRDERLVVFTSQGVIGRRLFEVALATARRRQDRRFIFRLHPNEALADYERLMVTAGEVPENFALSHGSPNIFALLSEAAIQVGVFSTTLFEGMVLGTRTVVVDMAGVEYMRPAVARGDVLLVKDAAELAEQLDAAPLCADPQHYYAEPPARLL